MNTFSVLLVLCSYWGVCLGVAQATSQNSASLSLINEPSGSSDASSLCGDCQVVADYKVTTVPPTETTNGIGSFTFDMSGIITPEASASGSVFAVFSSYSVTSEIESNGICSTLSGPPIPLASGSFSVPLADGPNGSSAIALQAAEESFMAYIGLVTCSAGGEVQVSLTHIPPSSVSNPSGNVTSPPTATAYWTGNITSSTVSSIASFSSSTPQTTKSSNATVPSLRSTGTSLSAGAKTAVGVAVPVGSILLLVSGGLLLRRSRKRHKGSEKHIVFPFFQPKPELSGEDSRYEMPADGRINEVLGDARVYEMPQGKRRQELEGYDGTQELEVSR